MSKTFMSASALAILAAAAITPASAQDVPQYTQEMPASSAEVDANVNIETAQLTGKSIYDLDGQEVGTVAEVVTAEDGSERAVISVGTFLGIGSKEIAVPVTDLEAKADGSGYSLSLTADEIEAAPAYEGDTGAM